MWVVGAGESIDEVFRKKQNNVEAPVRVFLPPLLRKVSFGRWWFDSNKYKEEDCEAQEIGDWILCSGLEVGLQE